MKKVRVTDVPLPGSEPKSLHKARQKTAKSQLSKEFVGVSSEEESGNRSQEKKSNIKKSANVKTPKAVAAPPTKPNGTSSAKRTYSRSGSESESDSDSESEELEERDRTDVPMKGSNSNAGGAEAESEESASGSSSSEEDGSGSGSSSEDSGSEELNTNILENAGARYAEMDLSILACGRADSCLVNQHPLSYKQCHSVLHLSSLPATLKLSQGIPPHRQIYLNCSISPASQENRYGI